MKAHIVVISESEIGTVWSNPITHGFMKHIINSAEVQTGMYNLGISEKYPDRWYLIYDTVEHMYAAYSKLSRDLDHVLAFKDCCDVKFFIDEDDVDERISRIVIDDED